MKHECSKCIRKNCSARRNGNSVLCGRYKEEFKNEDVLKESKDTTEMAVFIYKMCNELSEKHEYSAVGIKNYLEELSSL